VPALRGLTVESFRPYSSPVHSLINNSHYNTQFT
jgi:hypothetical protein